MVFFAYRRQWRSILAGHDNLLFELFRILSWHSKHLFLLGGYYGIILLAQIIYRSAHRKTPNLALKAVDTEKEKVKMIQESQQAEPIKEYYIAYFDLLGYKDFFRNCPDKVGDFLQIIHDAVSNTIIIYRKLIHHLSEGN